MIEELKLKPVLISEIPRNRKIELVFKYEPLLKQFLESNVECSEIEYKGDVKKLQNSLNWYCKNHDLPIRVILRGTRLFLLRLGKQEEIISIPIDMKNLVLRAIKQLPKPQTKTGTGWTHPLTSEFMRQSEPYMEIMGKGEHKITQDNIRVLSKGLKKYIERNKLSIRVIVRGHRLFLGKKDTKETKHGMFDMKDIPNR